MTSPPMSHSNDTFAAQIPRLEADSSNWAVFTMHFKEAMQATCHWGHFDGTTPHPSFTVPSHPSKEKATAIAAWDQEDLIAWYRLSN
jgi:hypothetical protein